MSERIDIADIAPIQYAEWRNNPVTIFMFQYMRDFAKSLEEKMLLEWRAGAIKLADETEARGRVMTLTEIPDLQWLTIQNFYGVEEKPDEEKSNDE